MSILSKPLLSGRVFELLADEIGSAKVFLTKKKILHILEESGVSKTIIESYVSHSKRDMLRCLLQEIYHQNKEGYHILIHILKSFTQSCYHNTNTRQANLLAEKLDAILWSNHSRMIIMSGPPFPKDNDLFEICISSRSTIEREHIKDCHEELSDLLEIHYKFISLIRTFCRNPYHPTQDLNERYLQLQRAIIRILDLIDIHTLIIPYLPFPQGLFTVTEQWTGFDLSQLWDYVRPRLYKIQSDIHRYYQDICGSQLDFDWLEAANTETREEQENLLKENVLLDDITVIFDEKSSILHLGSIRCELPPFGKEHQLLSILFSYEQGISIDWSEIWCAMNETNPDGLPDVRYRQSVYDTVRAINKRVQKHGVQGEFIKWKNKMLRRNA